jgi:hypothetical protein
MSIGLPVAAAALATKVQGSGAPPPKKCRPFAVLRRVPLQSRQGAWQAPLAVELHSDPALKSARNAFEGARCFRMGVKYVD